MILTDEERNERIKMVYEYFKETHESYRNISNYFTKKGIKMSHVTIKDYIEKAIKLYGDKEAVEQIRDNRGDLSSKKTKDRVKAAAKLYMQGHLVNEIAEILNEEETKIYRDLTERLPKVDLETAKIIKQKMTENRLSNLNKNKKSVK